MRSRVDGGDEIASARTLQRALHQRVPGFGDAVVGGIGADAETFEERRQGGDGLLRIGGVVGDRTEVLSGLAAGDSVLVPVPSAGVR